MTLVDTGVWIDHFRVANLSLSRLLSGGEVRAHPFVIGELAMGHLPDRANALEWLTNLPRVTQATDQEVMVLVEQERLSGAGIGWVDAHLLAAARMSSALLWTRDRDLARVANRLRLAYMAG